MNSSKPFRLKLLGNPLLVRPEGDPVAGRAVQRHRLATLALLSLASGHALTRDKLIGYLWPESDGEHARQLLNQAVYQLRQTMGEKALLSSADELRINPDTVESDVAEFESALAGGDAERAVALYRGPFLDGFFVNDAPELDHWIDLQRQRLALLFAKALETLAEEAEKRGDRAAAIEWWQARSAHDPYDTRVALRLISALDSNGNRAAALQHAEQHTRRLREEFGIAPPAELQDATERMRQDPEPRAPARAVPVATAAAASPAIHFPVEGKAASARAGSPAPAPARRSRRSYVVIPIALVLAVAAVSWLLSNNDERWLLKEAIPRIEAYLDVADWEPAFELAREADRRIPNSPELAEVWPRVAWRVSIHSQPEGATVLRQAYNSPNEPWENLGTTPLDHIRFPYGVSRLRFELAGYQPLTRALGGAHLNWSELKENYPDDLLVGPELFKLDTDRTLPRDMVRVAAWMFYSGGAKYPMHDFFIGRYEVTNAEYKKFVDARGYQDSSYWDPILLKGQHVPWRVGMQRFVDRTGRPGPSTWEAGDYPRGQADFPVSGVSWYEAAAFARFIKRELPTAHHWQQALANSMFPWLLPLSNFSGERARSVYQSRAMTHVGAYDMTGNVREWTSSAIGEQRVIPGGSWNDPYYIAGAGDTSAPPEDRSASNGFRLALTADSAASAQAVRKPITRSTVAPTETRKPVSDTVYRAYSRVFDYDRTPLNAHITTSDTTRLWIRQLVRFAAAYGNDSLLLHLYLPTNAQPPFQTVIYWPGWDTFWLDDADEYFAKQIDFIVKSGRAVAFPVYYGIFQRRVANQRRRPEFGTAEYRDNTINTVKDMRRTIDYLESRSDIKRDGMAYFGYSWGGVNGPVAIAQEPRLRVAIIDIGLLPPMSSTPEVDPVNSLPRVKVPTLMFSGEFDAMVPRENSDRYFELIGTPVRDKKHVIAIGGHFIPRELLIRESLEWLDKYLGTPGR